jgi:transcription elongation GreA/GreB family factor
MDKILLKSKILDAFKKVQLKTIENLNNEIEDARKMVSEISCPVDRDDGGYQAQLLNKTNMFAGQLQKAKGILDVLNKINPEKQSLKVDFGAVVITGRQRMFISVSIGKIEVDGESYYAISPMVPVYKAMKGKRAGDTFSFNGKKLRIIDVF